jgi:hypothetical protein
VPGHCDIKGNEEADRLARMGSDSHFYRLEPCVPLPASIVRDINKSGSLTHTLNTGSHLTAVYRQSKLWIKHLKLQTTKYLKSLPNSFS